MNFKTVRTIIQKTGPTRVVISQTWVNAAALFSDLNGGSISAQSQPL